MATDDKPFFISQNSGFEPITAADELLHPERNARIAADSATETQYFGFCVPEHAIHGYAYLWHHPNLHIVSGGLFAWRGHTRTVTHGELCDYRNFMHDRVLANDLHDYRLENGYGVKVVEPLKRHRLTYADAARKNRVEIDYEAVSPPVMFADGNHFEQAMRGRGTLTLRGATFAVDCYTLRDRSWGKPRPEDSLPLPAASWTQGIFGDDLAFSANVFDQAETSLELQGTPLAQPLERSLNGGWIWRDGKVGRLVRAKKRIEREPGSRMPRRLQLEITDEFDRTLKVDGTCIASTGWMPWSNIFMPITLMRWTCEGRVAHGDCQEGVWSDFLNLHGAAR